MRADECRRGDAPRGRCLPSAERHQVPAQGTRGPEQAPITGEVGAQESCNSSNLRRTKRPSGLAKTHPAAPSPLEVPFWCCCRGVLEEMRQSCVLGALSCPIAAAKGWKVTWAGLALGPCRWAPLCCCGWVGSQQLQHRCSRTRLWGGDTVRCFTKPQRVLLMSRPAPPRILPGDP